MAEKWEIFIGCSIARRLGNQAYSALTSLPIHLRPAVKLLVRRAMEFNSMTEEDVEKLVEQGGWEDLPIDLTGY